MTDRFVKNYLTVWIRQKK